MRILRARNLALQSSVSLKLCKHGNLSLALHAVDYADPIQETPQKRDESPRYPLEQRVQDKIRGIGRQKYPFAGKLSYLLLVLYILTFASVWTLTVAMVAIMIYELVRNSQEQGTPISFHPVVNPMLGPSETALVNFGVSIQARNVLSLIQLLGARYPACMKVVEGIPLDIQFGCPNNTANPPTILCSLEAVCGFGGFHGGNPNQWFRWVILRNLYSFLLRGY